jgi:hypothetical protein
MSVRIIKYWCSVVLKILRCWLPQIGLNHGCHGLLMCFMLGPDVVLFFLFFFPFRSRSDGPATRWKVFEGSELGVYWGEGLVSGSWRRMNEDSDAGANGERLEWLSRVDRNERKSEQGNHWGGR